MRKKSIALIGMPGAGKSSVGAAVAQKLNVKLIDTDTLVEETVGCSISALFAERGEAYFREKESEAIRSAVRQTAVIACGGGAVLRPQNAQVLRENATVVYLAATEETLSAHVGDGDGRPLLSGDARARVRALLREREKTYLACADVVVRTDGKSIEETAAEVIAATACEK